MLRAHDLIPCRRIVFSTFRRCMGFHTAWVRNGKAQNEHKFSGLPPKADLHHRPPLGSNAASTARPLIGQREARCGLALDQAPDHHLLRGGVRDAGHLSIGA